MRNIVLMSVLIVMLSAALAVAGEVSRDTLDLVGKLADRAKTMETGKVGEYAKDSLTVAQATISAAQGAVSVGNEKLALRSAEVAELQLSLAEARADEKEMIEQTALRRAELRKLEAQLDKYLNGGEK